MPGDIAVAGIGNCNLKFKFAAAQAERHLNWESASKFWKARIDTFTEIDSLH